MNMIIENASIFPLILFFGIFCYVIYKITKTGAKKEYEKYSSLVLDEDRENNKDKNL